MAFNAGSQGSVSAPGDGEVLGTACVSTVLAGAAGALTSMVTNNAIVYFTNDSSKWSLLTTLNGGLCAMVRSHRERAHRKTRRCATNVVVFFALKQLFPQNKNAFCSGGCLRWL